MSNTVSGVVEKVNVKRGKGKSGKPWALWSIKVDGEFYSCGFTKPQCVEGDSVTFKTKYDEEYDKHEVIEHSLEVTEEGAGDAGVDDEADEAPAPKKKAPAKQPAASGKSAPAGKDDYWKRKEEADVDRQAAIQFSWATTAAISMLDLFHKAGGEIALGKVKNRQLGTLVNEIERLRDRLLGQVASIDYIKSAIAGEATAVELTKKAAAADVEDEAAGDESNDD